MRILVWILGLLLLTSVKAAIPEAPRFRVVGIAQGLPSTDIKDLARDHEGYVWIATADGLARYDGIGMRLWRYSPGRRDGLPGNNVQALLVDRRDRVWAAVEEQGVHFLDSRRDRFQPLQAAGHPELATIDVWTMAEHGDALWLGTYERGLYRVAGDGAVDAIVPASSPGLPSATVLSLADGGAEGLWIGTDAGLARLRGGRVESMPLPGDVPMPMIVSLYVEQGRLWVGSSAGVFVHGRDGWSQPSWSAMFERPNVLTAIAFEPDGSGWIGSQRGLWRWQPDGVPSPVAGARPGPPEAVRTLLRQPDGALWAPLAGNGLGYLRSDWRRTALLSRAGGQLHDDLYRALAPAREGGLWLAGSSGSLERLAPDGTVQQLDADTRARLQRVRMTALAEDADGRLWVGLRNGLLRIGLDGAIDEWGPQEASDPVPAGPIALVRAGPDGSLWLSAQGGGLQQRDPRTGAVLLQAAVGSDPGVGDGNTEALEFDAQGVPWIATGQGLARLVDGRFEPVAAMRGARVHAFDFDRSGGLWLQRVDGLEHWTSDAGRWRLLARIGVDRGLPAVAAHGLRVDPRGRVWWSTPRGLYRWDPASARLRQVAAGDGSDGRELIDRALVLTAQGVLAAASRDGNVLLVDAAAAEPVGNTPALRAEGISVRRDGVWTELPTEAAPRLHHAESELRLSARLLAFDDPTANRYFSRLEHHDDDWVAQGESGDRVLSGLAPGEYRLRLRALDPGGAPAVEQVLGFSIAPPWWRTRWAWAVYAAALLAGILLAAYLYRARLKRRHALQLMEHERTLAERSSQAKSRFLADLGHEVRTPMTGVLGMSELLLAGSLQPRQREQAQAIRRAGEHLLRLLNDALDLARIEAGRLELDDAPFELRAVVDDVAGLMAPVAERKGLQFVDAIDADAPAWLRGDRTRVQQVLLNLIGNAVKFTEHGHVLLQVHAFSPRGVRVVVGDSGPGMSEQQRERLFGRFEQADGARTAARHGGSGLGLAISRELVLAMGGDISVESAPGAGSRFSVELPLAHADPPAPRADSAMPAVVAGDALQLLLVEDDALVAQTLVAMLQAQGHAVVHAAHALAALTEAAARPFDLALLDLDLPGMDGITLAVTLRAQGFAAPLLAVTARSDPGAEAACRAAGFDGFVRKPATSAMLAAAIAALRAAPAA